MFVLLKLIYFLIKNLELMDNYYRKIESPFNYLYEGERFYKLQYNFDIGEYNTMQGQDDKCNN